MILAQSGRDLLTCACQCEVGKRVPQKAIGGIVSSTGYWTMMRVELRNKRDEVDSVE